ncbi:hypothetical protein [Nonomuraea sp. NPDC050691]|uniref:hypothetical protein n=1 Tax=Nonomuraea sp. NPDC050691 TaxID=3155661 RepID=UPI00340C72EB
MVELHVTRRVVPNAAVNGEYEPMTFRPGLGGPTLIETEISLDFVKLPAEHLMALNQQTFAFPADFQEGFIDGSIYLLSAHNRVNVTRIGFGPAGADQITASLHAAFDFEHARTGIRNRTAELDTTLLFQLVDRLPAPQPPTRLGTATYSWWSQPTCRLAVEQGHLSFTWPSIVHRHSETVSDKWRM